MAPSLDPFPELCLIAIFMHLPLSDLLAVVGLVCSRWRLVLPTVLVRRCALKIVQTDSAVKELEPDYLYRSELIYKIHRDDGSPWLVRSNVDKRNVVIVPNVASAQILAEPFTNGLMDSFPNISNLTVIQDEVYGYFLPEVLTQITRMLDYWRDSLVVLTLSVKCSYILAHPEESLIRNLFESLNRLGSLRHLKIQLDFSWVKYEPELKICSQLNSLAFSSQFDQRKWARCITQYANADVITQISSDAFLDLSECLQFSPKLAAKFYQVGYFSTFVCGNDQVVLDNLETFCHRFTSVQYLSFVLTNGSLQTSFQNLAQLQHLLHLKLVLIPDNYKLHGLAPIRSVLLLTISVTTQSHHDLESFRLPQLFPNVQVLQMTHTSSLCRVCGYDGGWNAIKDRPEVWPKVHECKRLARQALTRFPKLHTIDLEEYPGTSEQITFSGSDIIYSLEQL